jgi:hypothetical protein
MTEAFEIGVSLALQDGVSDAIGKARRDVAALEQAVRESSVSLRSLREVGVRAASVTFGDPRRETVAGPVKPVVQAAAPGLAVEAAPRAEPEPAAPMDVAPRVVAEVLPRLDRVGPLPLPPPLPLPSRLPLETEAAPRLEQAVTPRVEMEAPPRAVEASARLLGDEEVSAAPAVWLEAVASPALADGVKGVIPPVATPPAPRDVELLMPATLQAGAGAPAALAEPVASASAAGAAAAEAPTAPQRVPGGMAQASAPGADTMDALPDAEAMLRTVGPVAPVAVARLDIEAASQTRLGDMHFPALSVAPTTPRAEAASVAPLADQPAARRGGDVTRAASPMTLLNALRLSGGSAPMIQSADTSAEVKDYPTSEYGSSEREAVQPVPVASAMVQSSAPPADAPRGAENSPPQQTEARDARPNEGDVFLDGMLVGRWMSRFLNREAERASAGPTGFDARRGRLLPGVTVGG